MIDYEKLGSFYLGREFDAATGKAAGDLVLYDSKDLVTHALIVGQGRGARVAIRDASRWQRSTSVGP
jgi:hypothetical protein